MYDLSDLHNSDAGPTTLITLDEGFFILRTALLFLSRHSKFASLFLFVS